MKKRSVGVKRIVTIFSVLSALGWFLFMLIASEGFSNVHVRGLLILILGMLIACLIPHLLCRVVYWVIDGFRKDKET